jgi:hypothetical protein
MPCFLFFIACNVSFTHCCLVLPFSLYSDFVTSLLRDAFTIPALSHHSTTQGGAAKIFIATAMQASLFTSAVIASRDPQSREATGTCLIDE